MNYTRRCLAMGLLSTLAFSPYTRAADWIEQIRADHPRLYFNADTWPAIQARAEGPLAEHLEKVCAYADGDTPMTGWSSIDLPPMRADSNAAIGCWGDRLMASAFAYRLNPDPERLRHIRERLWASLDYYHACYEQNKSVNWYARSRVGWLCAVDWVWNDLEPDERRELCLSMLKHMDEVLHKPKIQRRNSGGHTSGYYGPRSLALFVGLLLHNEGYDDEHAVALIKRGADDFGKLLAHRSHMAGDDGGAASATLGYAFGEYPIAEWNYLHVMASATGEDHAQKWPHTSMFPNYVMWNVLPGLLEFGYGDAAHKDNRIPRWQMWNHMSQIMHFFGRSHPERAAQAAYVRSLFPEHVSHSLWSIYPFLLTHLDGAPPPRDPGVLPTARFFENMGQTFMRSGTGDDDTYGLFVAGAITRQHTHYDATHFTIYKRGFLALDTGTREGNTDNLQNYYAQTIAHNCILIRMEGEPPSPYWNGKVYAQAGGQNRQMGSKVVAFETGRTYTYVAADATPVYAAEKCEQMVRQFLFLMPNHFVVFDRVVSTRADYPKTWLIHLANEPVQDGLTVHADQDRGRLFCRTLLPEDAVLEKVGGPGNEFLVEGVNYSITKGPAPEIVAREYTHIRQLQYEEVPELMGRWRLEVKPGAARTNDVFLHLLQVGNQDLTRMSEARVSRDGDQVVLHFAADGKEVTLSLNRNGPIGGHIRVTEHEQVLVDRPLTEEVMPQEGLAEIP